MSLRERIRREREYGEELRALCHAVMADPVLFRECVERVLEQVGR